MTGGRFDRCTHCGKLRLEGQPCPYDAEHRRALIDESRGKVTLDGHRACIMGVQNGVASVTRLDGRGGYVEFSWPTVQRIVRERGGAFRS